MWGCSQDRTFELNTELQAPLRVVWTHTFASQTTGAGRHAAGGGATAAVRCIAVLTKIVCAVDADAHGAGGAGAGMVGFDAQSGAVQFSDQQISFAAVYPTTIDSEIVVVNGQVMAGVDFEGDPTGAPIPLPLAGVYVVLLNVQPCVVRRFCSDLLFSITRF